MANSTIKDNLEEIRDLLNIDQPTPELGKDYAWYVGATGEDENGEMVDYSETFIAEGRWMNGWEDRFLDEVRSIKVGDKIALKSAYTRKKGLPFNNNGKTVGVMGIKAIGVVTDNPGDGRNIKVDWTRVNPVREWYGKGVLRATIHLVKAQDGLMKKLLLCFTFENEDQDYSLCEEQYANDIDDESNSQEIIVEESDKDYSLEELGQILSGMYNSSSNNKATSVHMFGIKYGKQIKEHNYSASAIIAAAGINASYHAELSKGISIYEAIANNEYGVLFYDGRDIKENEEPKRKVLPQREARAIKLHSLNTIIYGAPGTGKTYSTVAYALAILKNKPVDLSEKDKKQREEELKLYNKYVDEGKIVFTTFHQNYGYEDFIQGLRPDTKSNGMSFKDVDGVFKKIADDALTDFNSNYVIIIDEINRANISKVFGELITLIEEDKRWGETNGTCVTLPSGELFAVPNNLYIIGTMNSSDKSISLIDAALRRRFVFVEEKPNASLIKDQTLQQIFVQLNNRLADELDSTDLLIGHSYFMNKTVSDLPSIMNKSIIPLLYEYFYDNKKKVAGLLNDALAKSNYELVDEKLGRLYVKEKQVES